MSATLAQLVHERLEDLDADPVVECRFCDDDTTIYEVRPKNGLIYSAPRFACPEHLVDLLQPVDRPGRPRGDQWLVTLVQEEA